MTAMLTGLSWIIAGASIVVSAATLLVFQRPALAVQVLVDLLLAAALLRLSASAVWSAIAVTAAVILLGRLVGASLLTAAAVRPGGAPARRPTRR